MRETSFGKMDILLKDKNRPKAEYLIFEKDGRKHKHLEYESFVVLSGFGKVYSGENVFEVQPGDIVTIPPKTPHWMEPLSEEPMKGLLWYHESPSQLFKD